ncbi:MAG: YkvA family protein [Cytophagales bacterium]|jgi:uncharacterized membrane protein YkvA (DUF1232 family)|nr:YkvA family protein [Cytophagales bacterium]
MARQPSSDLLARVLRSVFFKRSQNRASRLLRNGKSLWELLGQVTNKAGTVRNASFAANLQTLVRMTRAYAQGRYKVVPWATVVKIVAALVYFVSPLDFVPDLLPVLGFSDDIAVVLWVLSSCGADIRRFEEWEAANRMVSYDTSFEQ